MKTLFARSLPALFASSTLFLAACASTPPPTEQVAVATAAVAHAAAAGAAELAPTEMRTASEKLDMAKAAVTAKNYDRAQSLAQEAQADASLAEAKSLSIKARKAAQAVNEDNSALREELDRKSK